MKKITTLKEFKTTTLSGWFLFFPFILFSCFYLNAQTVAPNFVNVESYPSSVSSVTVTMPAASAVGDVVLVYIVTDDDGTITAPGDFVQLANFFRDGNGPQSGLFYRVITGAESPTYSFSFPSEPAVVATLRYQNLDAAMPFMAQATGTGDSNIMTAPSVNTTRDNVTYLQFIGIDGASAGTLSALSPSATTLVGEQSGEANGAEMLIASELQASAGATPANTFTFGGATDEWTAITLALNAYSVNIVSPVDASCIMGGTTLSANYTVSASSGNFELVDPSGMVVATQSYATSSGTVSFTFTPTATGNYTVREQAIPSISSFITIYIDTDNDTVCDLYDIDDDNDGILDVTESPNCYLSAADFPYESGDRTSLITVSTEWTINSGTLANILNGSTTDNAVRKSNGDFVFSGQEFLHFTLPNAFTFDAITIYHEGAVFLDAALVGVVQGSNDGSSWTDLIPAGSTVLPDAASPHTITLTQNLADYTHYRIYVTSGRIDDDEYLREVEFSMIIDSHSYPKASCTDDIDGDLIPNHLDLDSDGDGCSDALEAGATTDLTVNYQFPIGSSGANGLPDAVETPAESGIINYTSSYDPFAISDVVKGCFDSDNDTVLDVFDLDADGDGILNTVENNAPCTGDGLLNWTSYSFPSNLSNTSQLPGNTITGMGTSGTVGLVGMSGTRFGLIFTGYLLITENGSHTFTLNSDDGSSLHIDGSEVINTASNTTNISLTPGWHQIEVRFYENTGGESLSLTYQSPSAGAAISVPDGFFSTTIPECDTDGIPNFLDLDSDGDGIPDNIEGQATLTYTPPAANTPAQYVTNNGVNTAYLGGLTPPDTELDGIPDFLDLESDADRIDDADESGLPSSGAGATYADVNGIVNDPNTDLAHVTTASAEADYRDKKAPTVVKVCYNSDQYSISGGQLTFADDKLVNLNNWGADGIDVRYQFDLFSFGTGAVTEAALIANGCQIFYAGGTNSDAGNFNPGTTSALSASDKLAILNWGASPNNVVISAQGYGAYFGGAEYAGTSGNSNPNSLTPLGEVVISGLFGQTASFNQGGSYQGRFTAYPSTACVITQDNNGNPTGLLDGIRGDFYFADFDMLSELGGLSNSNNITSNTDMLFANLFSSAAMVALEGPTNACNAFLCPAGDVAPALTSNTISSAGTPVDLTTLYTGTPPTGATVTWHTASPVADENYIGNPTSYTQPSTVYATFRAEDGSCYSPDTPVMVMIDYPDLEVTISPATETSAAGEVQSFTVTVTNNGPITAPDAIVKVPIPAERELILANPSMGAYSGSTNIWNIGQLTNGQSATLAITIRL